MTRFDRERQVRLLMTLRVVTVATLLVCAYAIELLLRPGQTLRPLFILSATAFGMVLLYAALASRFGGSRGFILLQLGGDALLVTFFVQITGGLSSPLSFLYLLPISVASVLLYRSGGFALAVVSWSLYAGLAGLGGGMPFGSLARLDGEADVVRTVYLLVAHLVGMLGFALLSSTLSERLRVQGHELDERQRAMARLQALNENIIESINSGLITTDLRGTINFMNRGGGEILGLDRREVEGRAIESLLGLGGGFLEEARARLLPNRRFRFERFFETKDQRRIFLGIAVSNLHDKTGRPLGYILIFQDLTEIHALEQEMRLKERMVALGEMAAGMAHELRNPLAAISGSVQYLKGDLKPGGETLELMDIILRESRRLDQAIRDFLTFARPGRFKPEPTDVVKLLEDNVRLLEKSPELRSDHRIETRFGAERIETLLDPNRMRQVFWNLAINALKAMPEGGCLLIEAALAADPGWLEIRFTDEGVGMDERQMEAYFQPFSSSFEQGTGLGAAIVYRLVGEHDGKIHVTSSRGGGTTVVVSLPHESVETTDQPAAPSLVAARG